MRGGEVVLSVDCGTVSTSAVVVSPSGESAGVRFDGADVLSSAVFLNADGSWLTGQRAWQAQASAPDRFEPSPLGHLREDSVRVGAEQVPSVDVVAATLRRVAQQSARQPRGAPRGEGR